VLARKPPVAVAQAVLRVGLHGRGDVRRQGPGRGRPDDERLARPVFQGEADVQRRVLELRVVLVPRLLVLRERGAAAWAPLRRAVALVEPAAAVALLQEAPDVLDVRVREGEVVVAPVHPRAEALELRGLDRGVLRDEGPAAARELGDAELLDLALRVEAERFLDLDLDVQALRGEAVRVAEVGRGE